MMWHMTSNVELFRGNMKQLVVGIKCGNTNYLARVKEGEIVSGRRRLEEMSKSGELAWLSQLNIC